MGASDMVVLDLPLLTPTPPEWAPRAASSLNEFLADHAVCEQAAALAALNLVAHYPDDQEMVEKLTSLAIEEVTHLRRVAKLLHSRGGRASRRRKNPYTAALHRRIPRQEEPLRKIDRLLVGALVEARSCERFTLLMTELGDREPEVVRLLEDLGPAEERHWELFHRLAARELDAEGLENRWGDWLQFESGLQAGSGRLPTVHG